MGEAAKKEEEKVVPVGPGAEGLEPEKDDEREEREDKRLAQSDEEPEDDKPGADGRRKESSKERRERAKKARDRERVELNFFMKRNEELEKRLMAIEGRTSQNESAAIDQRLTNLKAQITNAQRVMVDAMKKPNGGGAEEFNEALDIRDQLRDELTRLSGAKQVREQAPPPQARATADEAPDPRVIQHAKAWANEHDWYDFNGRDMDSLVVRAIDESLAAEGFNATSADYWEELTDRAKKLLPHKFKGSAPARAREDDDMDEEDERPRQQAGPKFSSGGRERPLKKGEVYVSAERKRAMQEYGVWEDPVARNRMLKKYAQWDEELASSPQER